MILLLALVVAVVFAAGISLLLARDLVRMTAGALLISQAINLYLMVAGLSAGRAPVLPAAPRQVSDPLAQALTLTSVVISLGVAALLLALVHRVDATHGSIDVRDVVSGDEEAEQAQERDRRGDQDVVARPPLERGQP